MALRTRLVVARTFITAVKSATRPGSPGLPERAAAVPRMVRAAASGEYTGITRGRLALLVAAAAYLVSPIDLIPDFVLGLGLVDDAVVLSWLAATLVTETEQYLDWERSPAAAPPVPGSVADPGPAGA